MAYSKARRLGDLVSATGEVSTFTDASIVPADLNATLDLTGKTITVATASASDNDTTVASTAFVQQELASLVDSAPGTLNTLNELAAALGDDASFSTTVTNSIATKLPLAGGTMTGNLGVGDTAVSSITGLFSTSTANHIAGQFVNSNASDSFGIVVKAGNDANDYTADFRDKDNNNHMRIRGDGNVGIGVTDPDSRLEIKSSGGGSESALKVTDASSNNVFVQQGGGRAIFQYGPVMIAGETDIMHANMDDLQVGNAIGNRGMTIASGDGSYGTLAFGDGSSGNEAYRGFVEYYHSDDSMRLGTSGTERMRITSDGKVGIGKTDPNYPLVVAGTNPKVQIYDSDGNGQTNLYFGDSGSNLAGYIVYQHSDNAMRFGTNAAERMRITSAGKLLLGSTSDSFDNNDKIVLHPGSDAYFISSGQILSLNRTGSHGAMIGFYYQGSFVGSISSNANSLPSDKNFKRDINDLDLGLNLITKLKPSQYNYKIDSEDCPKMYGLIAQDLEESLTEVGVEKNSSWLLQHKPNDDEKESQYEVDYLKLTPVLIKAIQEQQTIIEDLKSRIETLEG